MILISYHKPIFRKMTRAKLIQSLEKGVALVPFDLLNLKDSLLSGKALSKDENMLLTPYKWISHRKLNYLTIKGHKLTLNVIKLKQF